MKTAKKNKLVLVTGGAGYKGSTLCRELLFRGYRVRVLDKLMYGGRSLAAFINHINFEFFKGDITNHHDIEIALEGVTDIIHLAAIVGDKPCERDPKQAVEVNYKATQYLAEMAKKKKKGHFLFASSCSNYGITDSTNLASEESELNPISLYAETKIDCERYLSELAKNGDFHPIMLRFSTAYGVSGRTRFDLMVNSFTFEALKHKKIIVFTQDSWRPFIHVLDMARIYYSLLEIPKERLSGKILNAGWNQQNYMKKEIIEIIKEAIGDFQVDYVNNVEDKRSYRVDFTKMQNFLDISPIVTVKDGVIEVANAIRSGLLTEQDFENNRLK